MRERFSALRNLPPFLKLIWQTSPGLTLADLGLRLVRALLPVATLYIGKLIIDEVVALAGSGGMGNPPASLGEWLASGLLRRLGWLLAAEMTPERVAEALLDEEASLSILERRGLGKSLWENADAAAHVQAERESWDY